MAGVGFGRGLDRGSQADTGTIDVHDKDAADNWGRGQLNTFKKAPNGGRRGARPLRQPG